MLKQAWKFLVAGAVVTLGACGGGDGGTGPSFADSVSTDDALDMGEDVADMTSEMASQMNFGEPNILISASASLTRLAARHGHALPVRAPRFAMDFRRPSTIQTAAQLAQAEGCVVTMRGMNGIFSDFVDVNQNGIPDDAFISVKCTNTDSTSNVDSVVVSTEFEEYSVKERFGDLYGFDASATFGEVEEDEFGNLGAVKFEAEEHLSLQASNAGHRFSFTVTEDSMAAGDAEVTRFQLGESWDGHFDPDGSIVLGDPLPDGELTFSGRSFIVDPEADNISFTLETTTPLTYSAACAGVDDPPFTAGVVHGRLNNSSSAANFDLTFTACGAYTIDVDGAYDEPVVVVAGR